jgi:hypothetical protein
MWKQEARRNRNIQEHNTATSSAAALTSFALATQYYCPPAAALTSFAWATNLKAVFMLGTYQLCKKFFQPMKSKPKVWHQAKGHSLVVTTFTVPSYGWEVNSSHCWNPFCG